MERFAPQPILSTTKLRKMIDVGAVSRDLFRFLCRFGRARARAHASEREGERATDELSCSGECGTGPRQADCCTQVMDHGKMPREP